MPVKGNKLYCPDPDCDFEQPQINLTNCKRCGHDLGAPNVNEVSADDEKSALQKRYDDAINQLAASGLTSISQAFENYFSANVNAVINASFATISAWLLNEDAYKSYYRLTDEGVRDIALPENDRRRNIVDGFIFGSYGTKMVFAAISLNTSGLNSYGECTIVLDETLISKRSTILEENSYNFAKRYNVNFEEIILPKGYRAIWENKQKLAIAKLYGLITATTVESDFCDLVLFSKNDRHTEEFMEVHIYKELSAYAAKNIHVPNQVNRKKLLDLKKLQSKYPCKVFIV